MVKVLPNIFMEMIYNLTNVGSVKFHHGDDTNYVELKDDSGRNLCMTFEQFQEYCVFSGDNFVQLRPCYIEAVENFRNQFID